MADDIPQGTPFSQAYMRPRSPLQDDPRFRRRLSGLFSALHLYTKGALPNWLKMYGGIEIRPGPGGYYWDDFFKQNPIVEVLDAIGLICSGLKDDTVTASRWKTGVALILQEQAMAYRLDGAGAVRKLIDQEFERTRIAAIAGLGLPKYRVAKDFFDQAVAALEQTPPDAAGMVRNVFLANEEIFKLMFGVDRLVAGNVRNHLLPERTAATQSAITASQEMANSFAKWVGACQQYRHAPGEIHEGDENPAAPPLDLAIAMMSAGATFLRWLLALDR